MYPHILVYFCNPSGSESLIYLELILGRLSIIFAYYLGKNLNILSMEKPL